MFRYVFVFSNFNELQVFIQIPQKRLSTSYETGYLIAHIAFILQKTTNVLKKPTTAMRMPHVLILMVIFTASVTLDFSEVVEIVQVIKYYILYFFWSLNICF